MLAAGLFGTYMLLMPQGSIYEFHMLEIRLRCFSLEKPPLFIFVLKLFGGLLHFVISLWGFAFFVSEQKYHFLSVFWLFIVPKWYLVYLSCSWSVTTFLVWLRFLTSLHMANLVISFGSRNFVHSSEKHSHLVHDTSCTALRNIPISRKHLLSGAREVDLSHCRSSIVMLDLLICSTITKYNRWMT